MRLTRATLADVPAAVGRPSHDPSTIGAGIVHFGPGAFHRAHQADYIDRLLATDPRWGIVEASLRSGSVTDRLIEQDGLYTLAILDRDPQMRVVGAVAGCIGPGQEALLATRLADPAIRLVTSTVTEKGYCLGGDGTLDFGHPDIVADLGGGPAPRSILGWIVNALSARRAAGIAPFAVLPCDNMPDNGARVRAAVLALAGARDADLAAWIAGEVRFASSMVDSITPASDAALLARVTEATGLDDRAAVQREGFAQWVVEDVLPAGGPDLAAVGVAMTNDVAGYEQAKLRILNGAHSSLAYLGLLRGHVTVSDAMADAALARFVEAMVTRDVVPGLAAPAGLDLPGYVAAVFGRFRNPAIRHLLAQIAQDGSQKLPYRIIDSLRQARADGRPYDRLLVPIAAWMRFLADAAGAGRAVVDPLAERLSAAARSARPVRALLAIEQVFPADIAADAGIVTALERLFTAFADPDETTRMIAA